MFVGGNTLNKNMTCDRQTRVNGEAGPTNPWHNSGAVCVTEIIAADFWQSCSFFEHQGGQQDVLDDAQ